MPTKSVKSRSKQASGSKQNAGANPPRNQPHAAGVVEVLTDLSAIMSYDHLHTVPREFHELTGKQRLHPIVAVGLDFLPRLQPGGNLYGVVQHEGQFIFHKYQVHSIVQNPPVEGHRFTTVGLIHMVYTFDPATGAPLELYLYPNFGKFLICDHEANTSHLHEQIQGQFYPRPQEVLFYEGDPLPPA